MVRRQRQWRNKPMAANDATTAAPHATNHASVVDATGSMSVTERLDYLLAEINGLKERNVKKDRGKEFEGSYTRVGFLMVITYWTLFAYMALVLKTDRPFLDAIVPTVGFNISTWSLPYVKEWWIQARHYYMHGETEATTNQRSSSSILPAPVGLSGNHMRCSTGDGEKEQHQDEEEKGSDPVFGE